MQKLRKYGAYVLIVALAAFLAFSGAGSCGRKGQPQKISPPRKDNTYEPKFRKDGDLWLLKANGDTLKHLDVEYANTASRIEYGMMYRKSMEERMGMLFFMGNMQMRSFWMKNTYVSLDIIYIDDKLEVVSIQKNAEPLNTSSLASEGPAMYVLEVKGGLCDKIGFGKGDKISFNDIANNQ